MALAEPLMEIGTEDNRHADDKQEMLVNGPPALQSLEQPFRFALLS